MNISLPTLEVWIALPTTWLQVVQSVDALYCDGAAVPGGKHVHFAISEIKGDWKWQAETLVELMVSFCLLSIRVNVNPGLVKLD